MRHKSRLLQHLCLGFEIKLLCFVADRDPKSLAITTTLKSRFQSLVMLISILRRTELGCSRLLMQPNCAPFGLINSHDTHLILEGVESLPALLLQQLQHQVRLPRGRGRQQPQVDLGGLRGCNDRHGDGGGGRRAGERVVHRRQSLSANEWECEERRDIKTLLGRRADNKGALTSQCRNCNFEATLQPSTSMRYNTNHLSVPSLS